MASEGSPLVGGYRLEHDMVALWFRPGPVELPPFCACCGEETHHRTRLSLWSGAGHLDYPHCPRCQRHSMAAWWIMGIALSAGLAVVGALALWDAELTWEVLKAKPMDYLSIGGFVVLIVAAPIWYALSWLPRKATCEYDAAPLWIDIAGEVMPWNKDDPPPPKTAAEAIARELKTEAGETGYGVVFSAPRFVGALLELHGAEETLQELPPKG